MTEPVAALSAVRPRDAEVGGLPMPKLPPERHLRDFEQRMTFVVWLATTLSIVGSYMVWHDPLVSFLSTGLVLFGIGGWLVVRGRRAQRENADAIALLNARKFNEASAAFERLARRAPTALLQALAAYNVAAVAIRRGDVERALSVLGALWRAKAHVRMGAHQLREQVPLLISMLYTQLGDIDAGERWLAATRKVGKHPGFAHTRNDIVAEATLLLRKAQYGAAAALLAEHWRAIEETTPAALMRNTRIMRAFALERAAAPAAAASAAEVAAQVEQLLAGCRPFEPGEYEPLGVAWPEVQAFLATHALT